MVYRLMIALLLLAALRPCFGGDESTVQNERRIRVDRGMTLSEISSEYLGTVKRMGELMRFNDLKGPDRILAGQVLLLTEDGAGLSLRGENVPRREAGPPTSTPDFSTNNSVSLVNSDHTAIPELKKASDRLREMRTRNPSEPGPYLSEMHAALRMNDFAHAREVLSEFDRQFPELNEIPFLGRVREAVVNSR